MIEGSVARAARKELLALRADMGRPEPLASADFG
jgi:hypothetical protein